MHFFLREKNFNYIIYLLLFPFYYMFYASHGITYNEINFHGFLPNQRKG